jgi:cytochrome P450
VYRLIEARRAQLQGRVKIENGDLSGTGGADLLGMLLEARDPETGAAMDDRQVRDEVITLLIAGHETVASALTWTFYLLARNPETRDRMGAELAQALSGRALSADDLPNLPYTRAAFEESLRLYPPAWIITRKALGDDKIEGFPIRKGSLVILSPYTLHRHPAYWQDPEVFDPDRFNAQNASARPRFAYFPFGGGPRLCIGDSFARFEAQLILACAARRFRLDLPQGEKVHVEALVTLRPRDGLKMMVSRF